MDLASQPLSAFLTRQLSLIFLLLILILGQRQPCLLLPHQELLKKQILHFNASSLGPRPEWDDEKLQAIGVSIGRVNAHQIEAILQNRSLH